MATCGRATACKRTTNTSERLLGLRIASPLMNPTLESLRQALAEPLPHPDAEQMQQLIHTLADWVVQHYASLPDQPIGRTASRPAMEQLLREAPPEASQPVRTILAEFEERVAAHAFRVNHPRFFAFVPGAPSFLSILGDLLCAGTNFFASVWLEAAGPAQVELLVLDWFKEFLGYPMTAGGLLTSGGSEANLTALVTAREPLTFTDRARAVLYVSDQRHWSIDRAAKVIGLHPSQVRPVPMTERFTLDVNALHTLAQLDRRAGRLPWAVVANAGATNTGAIDPLPALADWCRDQALWLHVDAAYGWPAVLTSDGRMQLAGIERADSITLDPHKWFGQTFEAGCLLVREGQRLPATFAHQPDYMQDVLPAADEVNFADHGIALTRRFRALKIWFSVKALGVGWFRSLIEHCCQLAAFVELLLRQTPGFEVVCPRQLSIVCFRYLPPGWDPVARCAELDRLNLAIVEELGKTGRAFLSSTRLRGQVALRFCFVNWRTTARDVEATVQLLAELATTVSRRVESV